jgi:SET domain-containing protein
MDCPFYTNFSQIHGRGLFSNQYFPEGSILFKVVDNKNNVTDLGKWINHSWQPNIILHKEKDGWYAVSIMPIYQGIEILGNYKWTPDPLEKPDINW